MAYQFGRISGQLQEFEIEYAETIRDNEKLRSMRDKLWEDALREIAENATDSIAQSIAKVALCTNLYKFETWCGE